MKFKAPGVTGRVYFQNFGYNPTGDQDTDWRRFLFGYPNFIKRLQAEDTIRALDISSTHRVLDFGCGVGYYTVELAKLGRETVGLDISPAVTRIAVPSALAGRLTYVQADGRAIPFADGHFDRILASEVLPMVPEPAAFARELARVLAPEGRVVVVTGVGHPILEEAFRERPVWFRALRALYPERMPPTYEDYCERLQKSFGTARTNFMTPDEIDAACEAGGLRKVASQFTPSRLTGVWFSVSQFIRYLSEGKTLSQEQFELKFVLFRALSKLETNRHHGGYLGVFTHAKLPS